MSLSEGTMAGDIDMNNYAIEFEHLSMPQT